MADEKYDGRMSRSDRCAVAASAIVGLPLFAALLLVDALADCAPDTACRKGFLLVVLVPSLAIAIAVGLLVRFLMNRFARQQ